MYLRNLSNEQKELFMDLCINASNANGEFDFKEKGYIIKYAEEMNIKARYTANLSSEDAICEIVKISSKSSLRAIAIELIALLLSDGKYDDKENSFLSQICSSFSITEETSKRMIDNIKTLSIIYDNLNEIVIG